MCRLDRKWDGSAVWRRRNPDVKFMVGKVCKRVGRAAPPSAAAADDISCCQEAVRLQLIKQKVPSLCWDPQITHILLHLYFSSQAVRRSLSRFIIHQNQLRTDLDSGCATLRRCSQFVLSHGADAK